MIICVKLKPQSEFIYLCCLSLFFKCSHVDDFIQNKDLFLVSQIESCCSCSVCPIRSAVVVFSVRIHSSHMTHLLNIPQQVSGINIYNHLYNLNSSQTHLPPHVWSLLQLACNYTHYMNINRLRIREKKVCWNNCFDDDPLIWQQYIRKQINAL